jgi:hypothetical protein
MVGAGSVIVVTGISDYVVDAYSKYAGSCMGIIANIGAKDRANAIKASTVLAHWSPR